MRINSFELWCWCRMLSISSIMKRTNDNVLQEVQVKTFLLCLIQNQMLSYFGHIARRDGENLVKVIMQGRVERSRKPGRPWARWIDYWSSSLQDLYSLAKNCQRWRVIVDVMYSQSWRDQTNQSTHGKPQVQIWKKKKKKKKGSEMVGGKNWKQ